MNTHCFVFDKVRNGQMKQKFQKRLDEFVREMQEKPIHINNDAMFNKEADKHYKFRQSLRVADDPAGTLDRYM